MCYQQKVPAFHTDCEKGLKGTLLGTTSHESHLLLMAEIPAGQLPASLA